MSLLVPLGLIGLIGLIILIIIYIIKPNYQNKYISSTYIWKLSLKYKKKKIPMSRIRNLLLFLCQILILTTIAFILAKPVHKLFVEKKQKEVIAILDSSASMRTGDEEETRFERAIEKIKDLSEDIFKKGGLVSIIVAEGEPYFLCERTSSENKAEMFAGLDKLLESDIENDINCSYGTADIPKAIEACRTILEDNNEADVYIYTDKEYGYIPKKINLVNVSHADEWNVAILDAWTEYRDNYYNIVIDLACYGKDAEIGIDIEIAGANAMDKNDVGQRILLSSDDYRVQCSGDQVVRVEFRSTGANEIIDSDNYRCFDLETDNNKFFSFKEIKIAIDEIDNFQIDNNYYIYGGQKEVLKIQYASTMPNNFVSGILNTLISSFSDSYDIQVTEVRGDGYATEGFNYYIFEHQAPAKLPEDGMVILLDPTSSPANAGFRITNIMESYNGVYLGLDIDEHPLLRGMDVGNIMVTRFSKIDISDADYQVLASYENNPLLFYQEEKGRQIFVMPFSVHYSNIVLSNEWVLLFVNMLTHFTPTIIDKNVYEVYDEIKFNSRGENLKVKVNGEEKVYTEFPASYSPNIIGTFEVEQISYFGQNIQEKIYVKIPKNESNIFEYEESLVEPYQKEQATESYDDLIFYFALALVILVFAEWWLKGRDNA